MTLIGLLLFACSHQVQHENAEGCETGQTERDHTGLHSLNTRKVANHISPQLQESTGVLLYRSELKKNIGRQVNSNLQDIAPKNAAIKNETKAVSFQKEDAQILGSLGIELENFFLSPEFKGGRNFGWGRIKLVAAF